MGMAQLSSKDQNALKNLCEVLGASFGGADARRASGPDVCARPHIAYLQRSTTCQITTCRGPLSISAVNH